MADDGTPPDRTNAGGGEEDVSELICDEHSLLLDGIEGVEVVVSQVPHRLGRCGGGNGTGLYG